MDSLYDHRLARIKQLEDQGHQTESIAQRLNISPRYVEAYQLVIADQSFHAPDVDDTEGIVGNNTLDDVINNNQNGKSLAFFAACVNHVSSYGVFENLGFTQDEVDFYKEQLSGSSGDISLGSLSGHSNAYMLFSTTAKEDLPALADCMQISYESILRRMKKWDLV